jgi:hypothetical protein
MPDARCRSDSAVMNCCFNDRRTAALITPRRKCSGRRVGARLGLCRQHSLARTGLPAAVMRNGCQRHRSPTTCCPSGTVRDLEAGSRPCMAHISAGTKNAAAPMRAPTPANGSISAAAISEPVDRAPGEGHAGGTVDRGSTHVRSVLASLDMPTELQKLSSWSLRKFLADRRKRLMEAA